MSCRTSLPLAVPCLALLLVSPLLAAEPPEVVRPFPLAVTADRGAQGLELVPLSAALQALGPLSRVTLVNAPVPGGGSLQLQLERVPVAAADAWLAVDGVRQAHAALDEGLTLWSGRVAGAASSEVFLAFSTWGSRGWIRTPDNLLHLLAQPGPGGDWSASTGLLVEERALRAPGGPAAFACEAMSLQQPTRAAVPRHATLPGLPGGGPAQEASTLPLLECRVAVETDHQYFQLFGNLQAAQAYAVSLFAAVSDRYREQVGVILTLPYLGLYTTSNDPWVSQDSGGGSLDLLYEFQGAWQRGGAPVAAHACHFLSGAILGGGVAYLPGVCDPDYGFGVSGNMAAATPFPIAVGTLNWDFIVVAHEIGHNFNALHTHDYCPPLDECAPAGYFGACQAQQACTNQGTIMSYCHLCDGGMLNDTTWFHAQSVADMHAYAATSCLLPFEGVLTSDLGFSLAGGGAAPHLSVSFSANPDVVHLAVSGAGTFKPGIVFLSLGVAMLPFKGGTLVPTTQIAVLAISSVLGELELPLGVSGSFPDGVKLYTQAWFQQSLSVYAASNGVGFELIAP